MPRNTSVVLSDHFNEFITEAVESGRYNSASDVVRAGLRMLERQEMELEFNRLKVSLQDADRQAVTEETLDVDLENFLAAKRKPSA
ncbi:type II toxin-antitoxin system ParD family antitoxin [Maritimibacter sp. 55A14]|uniref:type II toxin-antitoxin system ParD family antitoxin n=1 Tax=Maritimibacter sp. 55A14 TaxID=2174844 RepID=UPI000D60BF51|nr:type II toxin-antitoxin system ParD family antitoxin [Maritimibacter sp. 55A14]PWE32390.1 type II toxin-antitoxin system ParD family antitoxin [Maritimibacter sp. 55A14]